MHHTSSPTTKAPDTFLPVKPDRNILTAAKGGGIVFVGQLFQYGSRLIIAILMARLLGAAQLGLVSLAISAAFIVSSLALLGLPPAMVRYVSLYANRRDNAGLWGTLQIGLGFTIVVGVLAGIGLYLLANPIAEHLFNKPNLAPLLQVISLVVPFLALASIIASMTQGFKKMDYAVIGQNISQPATRLILIVIIALTVGLNATRALIAFGLASILALVVLLYLLNKLFSLNRPLRSARRDTKEMLRFALPVYLADLIRTFGGNLQTILLGALNTVTNVGIFTVASQLNLLGQMFHGSIVTASAPIVSELYDRGEREQMERFYQAVTKWTFTLNLPLFLVVLLFPEPILSIFGKSFIGGVTALVIMAWANLVKTGTGISGLVLQMTGNTTLKLINSLTGFGLMLGLNVVLIPRWGLVGAAVAALTVAIALNVLRLLEVFVLFRLLPYNSSFIKPIVAGLATLAVASGLSWLLPPEANLIFLAVNIGTILAVYAVTIFLLGLSQEDRIVLTRVIQRVKAATRQ